MFKFLMMILLALNVILVLCIDPEPTSFEISSASFIRLSMEKLNTTLLHEGLNDVPVDIHRFVYGI